MPAPVIEIPGRRPWRGFPLAMAAALLLLSCSDNSAPDSGRSGAIAIAPRFALGVLQGPAVTQVRVILTRVADETVARDMVIPLSPSDTIVDLAIPVTVRVPGEQFELRLELSDALGAILYVGGPVLVTASTTGTAPPVEVLLIPTTDWPIVFAGDSMGGLSSGIFTVNRDGTGLTNLVSIPSLGGNRAVYPRWAPDRSRVAYGLEELTTGGLNQNHLFVVSADGAEQARVVSDTNAAGARWSPDGTHLAFVCYGYDARQGLQIEDVCIINDVTGGVTSLAGIGDGSGRVAVTDLVPNPASRPNGTGAFAWDPTNPDRIAFVRDSTDPTGALQSSRIFTALFDGTTWSVQPLSPDVIYAGGRPLLITSLWLTWAPDGSRLAFAATDPQFQSDIFAINRDGTGLTQLTTTGDDDDDPVYSPTGTELLFTRTVSGASFDAWMMNADGSGQRQVTAENVGDYDVMLLGYDWSPDGQEIVLTGFDTPYGNLLIYRIPRTTTAATYFADRVLIDRGVDLGGFVRDIQPSWRP
jgi:dipeptidyl aminopeptidase/acylaminoacyl peptidase